MQVVCSFVPSQDIIVADLEVEDLECQILSKPQRTAPTQKTEVGAEQEYIMRMGLRWGGVKLLALCTFSTYISHFRGT